MLGTCGEMPIKAIITSIKLSFDEPFDGLMDEITFDNLRPWG
jgi:hypothetical protein